MMKKLRGSADGDEYIDAMQQYQGDEYMDVM
jgi:hypothetical protein